MAGFRERLLAATQNSGVCVGLDPVPEKLPEALRDKEEGIALFCEEIVRATAPFVAAYKPNLAFFEALGLEGFHALRRAIDAVRQHAPNALIIGDGKRNDIGSTAARYATAMFDHWGFDAVTVNPYLGWDGIKPFAEYTDRGVYLLAMTSNPSAVEVQDFKNHRDHVFQHVTKLAARTWNKFDNIGLVVGATRPERIAQVRAPAPLLPFLIPGVGAQGGDLAAAVKLGFVEGKAPALINASRSIIYASSGADFTEKAAEEAKRMQEAIQQLRKK